jgi:hypothetical protein
MDNQRPEPIPTAINMVSLFCSVKGISPSSKKEIKFEGVKGFRALPEEDKNLIIARWFNKICYSEEATREECTDMLRFLAEAYEIPFNKPYDDILRMCELNLLGVPHTPILYSMRMRGEYEAT